MSLDFIKNRENSINEEIKVLENQKQLLGELLEKAIKAETSIQFALVAARECGAVNELREFLLNVVNGINSGGEVQLLQPAPVADSIVGSKHNVTNRLQKNTQPAETLESHKFQLQKEGLTTRQLSALKREVKLGLGFKETDKPRKEQIHGLLVVDFTNKAKVRNINVADYLAKIQANNSESPEYWIAAKNLLDAINAYDTELAINSDAPALNSPNYAFTTKESDNPFKIGDILRHKESGEFCTVDTDWLPIHGGSVGCRMPNGLQNAIACIKLELVQSLDAVGMSKASKEQASNTEPVETPPQLTEDAINQIKIASESEEEESASGAEIAAAQETERKIANPEAWGFTLEDLHCTKEFYTEMFNLSPETHPDWYEEVDYLIELRTKERAASQNASDTDSVTVDVFTEHYEVKSETMEPFGAVNVVPASPSSAW